MDIGWFSDPGHAWLRIPLTELGGFIPSEYSYRDATYAYLEEDCDAPDWISYTGRDFTIFPQIHTMAKGESKVRNLTRFPN